MGIKTKQKAPAIAVPQDDHQADEVLSDYAVEARALAEIQTRLDASIAAVKSKFEEAAAPHKEKLKTCFEQLQAYAATHRDRLTTDGKIKTVDFPSGKFGWRTRPPSVRIARSVKIEEVIASIKKLRLPKFLRVKEEINKEAMLDDSVNALKVWGVTIGSAGEDFFVEPAGLELAQAAQ